MAASGTGSLVFIVDVTHVDTSRVNSEVCRIILCSCAVDNINTLMFCILLKPEMMEMLVLVYF